MTDDAKPGHPTIAIIGAGLSGALLAINLLRQPGPNVILIERTPGKVGRGVAYATDNPRHLLNVRACNMSAFPDDPAHFSRWLGFEGAGGAHRFVQRQVFGAYICEQLDAVRAVAGDRLRLVEKAATAAVRSDGGWAVSLFDGEVVRSDMVVLAQGNFPPADLPDFGTFGPPLYFTDCWAREATQGLSGEDPVLLIGAGLTAVDVALSLENSGFQGDMVALSRRGLRPRSHSPTGPEAEIIAMPDADGAWLINAVRRRAREIGWRGAVDELRPHTQDLWRRLDVAGRARFIRHLRPFWDVHRHRLAPAVDQKVGALQMEGRLQFKAGKITQVEPAGDGAMVEWRVRGGETRRRTRFQRIISCTGPLGDVRKCHDPLIQHLRLAGLIRPDCMDLGVDVDRHGRVRTSEGAEQDDLLAIGPMTRGEAWEVVAVPDIRRQVRDLAHHILSRSTDHLARA